MSSKNVALGEVCIVKRGTTITQKEAIEGEIPVVAGGLKPTYYHNQANRLGNTITISGSGANAGFVNFWNQPIFASDCSTVEVINNKLDITYVYYFLLSKQQYIYNELRSGAAQPHVYGKDIAKIVISIPSIPTQQKIVAKLDAIFAEIDTATAAAEASANNAKALFQSYLTEVFERGGEGWELSTLGEYYDVRDGTHDSPKFQDLGYPLVTSKNLKNGNINFEKIQYISKEDYLNISQRSGVKKGDVLMAMIGTIGNPVVVDTDNEFAIKNVALFKTNNSQSSKFLSYYLSSDYVIKKMEKDAKGTTQKFVGLGYLRSFPIKFPNKSSQEKVVETLGNYENHIKILSKSYVQKLNELLLLKQSILQRAFSGELVKD